MFWNSPSDDPRPVKSNSQDRYPERDQLGCNVTGRKDVLRAREAMSEQRIAADTRWRQVQARCELVTETAREGHADHTRAHGGLQKVSACGLVRGS